MTSGRALIFDCDGVLADTERYGHLPAFNQTFAEFGLPVHWSVAQYGEKLRIGGGKERMASLLTPEFVAAAGLPADRDGQQAAVAAWHRRKTEIYTAAGRLRRRAAALGRGPDHRRGPGRGLARRGGLHLGRAVGGRDAASARSARTWPAR